MHEPRCDTCKFWKRTSAIGEEFGDCRRLPPLLVGYEPHNDREDKDRYIQTGFPVTDAEEWCGEYEEKKAPDA